VLRDDVFHVLHSVALHQLTLQISKKRQGRSYLFKA
jgi:hypothetical protein